MGKLQRFLDETGIMQKNVTVSLGAGFFDARVDSNDGEIIVAVAIVMLASGLLLIICYCCRSSSR